MTLRKPADSLLEHIQPQPAASSAWKTYEAELVTPLFGGGVEAGKVDPTMPFRAASIRGQLRFWWRIAHGPFDSAKVMFQREKEIWGGLDEGGACKSKVRLRVESKGLKAGDVTSLPNPTPGKKYALGPAFADTPADLLLPGARFLLHLACEENFMDEAMTALRWWSSFGGLGARTRRGLGAIHLKGLTPVSATEVQERQGHVVFLNASSDALSAWNLACGALQQFRQGKNIGRNEAAVGSNSPAGRSRWPEPDALRVLSRNAMPKHAKRVVEGDFFPRAAFGLPLVYHFKDSKAGDPKDHMLVPDGAERMASPLILRPYWNGEAWQPAALLLPGWEAAISQPLAFKEQRYRPVSWPADEAGRRAAAAKITPMKDRGTDALSAFMAYFGEAK